MNEIKFFSIRLKNCEINSRVNPNGRNSDSNSLTSSNESPSVFTRNRLNLTDGQYLHPTNHRQFAYETGFAHVNVEITIH